MIIRESTITINKRYMQLNHWSTKILLISLLVKISVYQKSRKRHNIDRCLRKCLLVSGSSCYSPGPRLFSSDGGREERFRSWLMMIKMPTHQRGWFSWSYAHMRWVPLFNGVNSLYVHLGSIWALCADMLHWCMSLALLCCSLHWCRWDVGCKVDPITLALL